MCTIYCFTFEHTLIPRCFFVTKPSCTVSDLDITSFLALSPSHQAVMYCFRFGHTLIPRSLPISPSRHVLFQIWTHPHSSLTAHLTKPSCTVSDLDTPLFLAHCPSHQAVAFRSGRSSSSHSRRERTSTLSHRVSSRRPILKTAHSLPTSSSLRR